MFRTLRTVEPETATEQAAYGKWLDQTSAREAGPQRPRSTAPSASSPPRCGSCCSSSPAVIFVFMLFFADSGERAVVQALLMGTRHRGHRGDAAPAAVPRPPVPRRASAASARWRWSARCRSSTRSWRPSAIDDVALRLPWRTRVGQPAVTRGGGGADWLTVPAVRVLVVGSLAFALAVAARSRLARRDRARGRADHVQAIAAPLMPALGATFAVLTALTLAERGRRTCAPRRTSSADEAAEASRLAWASTSPGVGLDADPDGADRLPRADPGRRVARRRSPPRATAEPPRPSPRSSRRCGPRPPAPSWAPRPAPSCSRRSTAVTGGRRAPPRRRRPRDPGPLRRHAGRQGRGVGRQRRRADLPQRAAGPRCSSRAWPASWR